MKLPAGLAAALVAAGLAVGAGAGALDPQLAQAAALRHAGRADEAVDRLLRIAAERPGDADVQLQLALAFEAAGQTDAARAAYLACLRLAPDYTDAHDGLQRLARRGGFEPRWRLDASTARSRLSDDLPAWRASTLAVARTGRSTSIVGLVEETRRFGRSDVYAEVLGARRMRGGGEVYAAVGGAPDADHRPRLALRGGGTSPPAALGAGLSAQLALDAAWARYPSGEVTSAHPAVIVSRGERASLTIRSYNVIDEQRRHRAGWGVQGAVQPLRRLTLRAGYADAPETSEGRTVEVKSASLGAAWSVDERTTVRLDGVREDRAAYDRSEVALGLARRF